MSQDSQNCSPEAAGVRSLLTKDKTEQELMTQDWMNWWEITVIFCWNIVAVLISYFCIYKSNFAFFLSDDLSDDS